MRYFRELAEKDIPAGCVFVDIDGTLVPDAESEVGIEETQVLQMLAQHHEVVLVSNKGGDRVKKIAAQFGVSAYTGSRRKPDPRISAELKKAPSAVIGDKILIDGVFSFLIGAQFIRVAPIKSGAEPPGIRALYMLDALVWKVYVTARLIRVLQWAKNLLVFVPLFFAGAAFDLSLLLYATGAFVAFSCIASAGYILNDVQDRGADQRHPTKRLRVVPAGEVSLPYAYGVGSVCAAVALLVSFAVQGLWFWILGYFALSILYTAYGKHVPILEMLAVSVFYLLRILAGGFVTDIPVSAWLLLTTFFATLFVTAGKRYAESGRSGTRAVLSLYPHDFLLHLPALLGGLTITAYALYSIVGSTHELLIYSNIFVVFGILWYLRGVYLRHDAEHPDRKLWTDMPLLIAVFLWGVYLTFVVYGFELILSYI